MASKSNYDAKVEATKQLRHDMSKTPSDVFNRLFFAARNGAISLLLRRLEHYLGDAGYVVRANWKETSFPGVMIKLVMHDKRSGEHTRSISIDRESVMPSSALPSSLCYKLNRIHNGEYYRSKKPKIAVDFDELLGSEAFAIRVAEWVNGVNYPFEYEGQSSF